MGDEHRDTGTGWPEREPTAGPPAAAPVDPDTAADAATAAEAAPGGTAGPATTRGAEDEVAASPGVPDAADDDGEPDTGGGAGGLRQLFGRSSQGRLGPAGLGIAVLLALLGFSLAIQVRSTTTDALAATRQEDLVRILSDLEAQEQRLNQEIGRLEESQRQLSSGAEGKQAALDEATRRADELGILAGTAPARGPGLLVRFSPGTKVITASAVLDAVQELRGAGAEAMQITGSDGSPVRIVASTYFLDDGDTINVSGRRLAAPYTITAIGEATTMHTALNIPGGVVASVEGAGGNVAVQERAVAEVTALSKPPDLQFARPVS